MRFLLNFATTKMLSRSQYFDWCSELSLKLNEEERVLREFLNGGSVSSLSSDCVVCSHSQASCVVNDSVSMFAPNAPAFSYFSDLSRCEKLCKRQYNQNRVSGVRKVAGCPRVSLCARHCPSAESSEVRLWYDPQV